MVPDLSQNRAVYSGTLREITKREFTQKTQMIPYIIKIVNILIIINYVKNYGLRISGGVRPQYHLPEILNEPTNVT